MKFTIDMDPDDLIDALAAIDHSDVDGKPVVMALVDKLRVAVAEHAVAGDEA